MVCLLSLCIEKSSSHFIIYTYCYVYYFLDNLPIATRIQIINTSLLIVHVEYTIIFPQGKLQHYNNYNIKKTKVLGIEGNHIMLLMFVIFSINGYIKYQFISSHSNDNSCDVYIVKVLCIELKQKETVLNKLKNNKCSSMLVTVLFSADNKKYNKIKVKKCNLATKYRYAIKVKFHRD